MKTTKKLLLVVLALALISGIVSVFALTASARPYNTDPVWFKQSVKFVQSGAGWTYSGGEAGSWKANNLGASSSTSEMTISVVNSPSNHIKFTLDYGVLSEPSDKLIITLNGGASEEIIGTKVATDTYTEKQGHKVYEIDKNGNITINIKYVKSPSGNAQYENAWFNISVAFDNSDVDKKLDSADSIYTYFPISGQTDRSNLNLCDTQLVKGDKVYCLNAEGAKDPDSEKTIGAIVRYYNSARNIPVYAEDMDDKATWLNDGDDYTVASNGNTSASRKVGYTITGWTTNVNGTVAEYAEDAAATFTSDTNLYSVEKLDAPTVKAFNGYDNTYDADSHNIGWSMEHLITGSTLVVKYNLYKVNGTRDNVIGVANGAEDTVDTKIVAWGTSDENMQILKSVKNVSDSGTYYIEYKAVDTANGNAESDSVVLANYKAVDVTIDKAPLDLKAAAITKDYGFAFNGTSVGADSEFVTTGTNGFRGSDTKTLLNGQTLTIAATYQDTAAETRKVNTYTASIDGTVVLDNYTVTVDTTSANWTITKRALTIDNLSATSSYTRAYNKTTDFDKAQISVGCAVKNKVTAWDTTIAFEVATAEFTSDDVNTKDFTYTLKVSEAYAGNYSFVSDIYNGTVTGNGITCKYIDITLEVYQGGTKVTDPVYNGIEYEVKASTDGIIDGDICYVGFNTSTYKATDATENMTASVGELTGADASNYYPRANSLTWSIAKADVTITYKDANVEYGSTTVDFNSIVDSIVFANDNAANFEIDYTNVTYTNITNLPTTDVGATCTISPISGLEVVTKTNRTVKSSNFNVLVSGTPVNVSVTKKTLYVNVENINLVYGVEAPTSFTLSYTGFVNDDDASDITSAPTINIASRAYAQYNNADTYTETYTVTGGAATNYIFAAPENDGNKFDIIVARKNIGITVSAKATYGDATPVYSATSTDLENSEEISVLTGLSDKLAALNYQNCYNQTVAAYYTAGITKAQTSGYLVYNTSLLGDYGNYKVNSVTYGALTIESREITIGQYDINDVEYGTALDLDDFKDKGSVYAGSLVAGDTIEITAYSTSPEYTVSTAPGTVVSWGWDTCKIMNGTTDVTENYTVKISPTTGSINIIKCKLFPVITQKTITKIFDASNDASVAGLDSSKIAFYKVSAPTVTVTNPFDGTYVFDFNSINVKEANAIEYSFRLTSENYTLCNADGTEFSNATITNDVNEYSISITPLALKVVGTSDADIQKKYDGKCDIADGTLTLFDDYKFVKNADDGDVGFGNEYLPALSIIRCEYYTKDAGTGNKVIVTYDGLESRTDVGDHALNFSINSGNTLEITSTNVKINKLKVIIKASSYNETVIYGEDYDKSSIVPVFATSSEYTDIPVEGDRINSAEFNIANYVKGSDVSGNGSYHIGAAGSGHVIYDINNNDVTANYDIGGLEQAFTCVPRPITVTIGNTDAFTKIYGQSDPAGMFGTNLVGNLADYGITFTGMYDSQVPGVTDLKLARAEGETKGEYAVNVSSYTLADNTDADSGKVFKAGNYTINNIAPETGLTAPVSFSITRKTVDISGYIVVQNKVYDGTVKAVVNEAATIQKLVNAGLIDAADQNDLGLDVEVSFQIANAGLQVVNIVKINGFTGTKADSYEATGSLGTTTARITPRKIVVTGITVEDKDYDGTQYVDLGKIHVENAVFTMLNDAGNGAYDKEVAGAPYVAGLFEHDSLSVSIVNAQYAVKGDVKYENDAYGDTVLAKDVTVNFGLGGTSSGNYEIAFTAAEGDNLTSKTYPSKINPMKIVVTGIQVASKIYDGTTATTFAVTSYTTPLNGNKITVVTGTANFEDKDAGLNKKVNVTYNGLAGTETNPTDYLNYVLDVANSVPSMNANISKRDIQVYGINIADRIYNGTKVVDQGLISGGQFRVADNNSLYTLTLPEGEKIGIEITAEFPTKDVTYDRDGSVAKVKVKVTVSLVPLDGDNVNYKNYNLTNSGYGDAEAAIKPAKLTVFPTAGQTKVYGAADPSVFAYGYKVEGVVTDNTPILGEVPNFDGGLTREAGENVDTYAYLLAGLTISDKDDFKASNYTLELASPAETFEITKRKVTIIPDAGQSKTYDGLGNTTETALTYKWQIEGVAEIGVAFVNGEIPSFTGAISRADGYKVADDYTYTIGNLALADKDTFDADNYEIEINATTNCFSITKRTVTITLSDEAVYNGLDIDFTLGNVNYDGIVVNDSISNAGKVTTTSKNVGIYDEVGTELTFTKPVIAHTGVDGDHVDNYTFVFDITVEITHRDLVISGNFDNTYNHVAFTADYGVTYTFTGDALQNGATITAGSFTTDDFFFGVYTFGAEDNAVTVSVPFTTSDGIENYNVSYDVTLTINKKYVDETFNESATYNGSVQQLNNSTDITANLIAGDKITAVTFETSAKDAKTYTADNVIYVTNSLVIVDADGRNVTDCYAITWNKAITINQREVVIMIDAKKTFDTNVFVVGYNSTTISVVLASDNSAEGLAACDSLTAGVLTTDAANVNVYTVGGTNKFTATTPFVISDGDVTTNYSITYGGTMEIEKRAITLSVTYNDARYYNGETTLDFTKLVYSITNAAAEYDAADTNAIIANLTTTEGSWKSANAGTNQLSGLTVTLSEMQNYKLAENPLGEGDVTLTANGGKETIKKCEVKFIVNDIDEKTYDGNTSATGIGYTFSASKGAIPTGTTVTVDETKLTYAWTSKDVIVGAKSTITASNVELTAEFDTNYTITDTIILLNMNGNGINPRIISIVPDADQSKEYSTLDPVYTYTGKVYEGNVANEVPAYDGAIARQGINGNAADRYDTIGEYGYLIGTLALKNNGTFIATNYVISFEPDDTFSITPLNLWLVINESKTYDNSVFNYAVNSESTNSNFYVKDANGNINVNAFAGTNFTASYALATDSKNVKYVDGVIVPYTWNEDVAFTNTIVIKYGINEIDNENFAFHMTDNDDKPTVKLTINQAELTVVANSWNLIYGDAVPSFAYGTGYRITGIVDGLTPDAIFTNFNDVTAVVITTSYQVGSDAGNTYDVTFKIKNLTFIENNNYKFADNNYKSGLITVAKRDLVLTVGTLTIPYASAIPTQETYRSVVTGDNFVGTDNFSVLNGSSEFTFYADGYGKGSNVDNYVIKYSGAEYAAFTALSQVNYNIVAVNTGILTVTPYRLHVIPETTNKTYDKNEIGEIGFTFETCPIAEDAASFKYDVDNASLTVKDNPINAGSYEFVIDIDLITNMADGKTFDAANYELVIEEVNVDGVMTPVMFTIDRASLTVTVDDANIVYGEDAPEFVIKSTVGLLIGDSLTDGAFSTNYDTATAATRKAGSYEISYSITATSNYDLTVVPGTLTVSKKNITITPYADVNNSEAYEADIDNKVVYGTLTPIYKAIYVGDVYDDAAMFDELIVFACQYEQYCRVTANGYTINATNCANDNYNITYVTARLMVEKATITVTANNNVLTFGDTPVANGYVFAGILGDDDTSVIAIGAGEAYTINANKYSPAYTDGIQNVYTISVNDIFTADNYKFAFVDGTLTFNKRNLDVEILHTNDQASINLVYGSDVPAYKINVTTTAIDTDETALLNAFAASDAWTFNGYEQYNGVGTYEITANVTDDNYTATVTSAEIVIYKATLIVTPYVDTDNSGDFDATIDNKVIYGDELATVRYTLTGILNNDIPAITGNYLFTTDYTSKTNVGTICVLSSDIISDLFTDNYEFDYTASADITINRRILTVTPYIDTDASKTFDAAKDNKVVYGDEIGSLYVTVEGWAEDEDRASIIAVNSEKALKIVENYDIGNAAGSDVLVTASGFWNLRNYEFNYVDTTIKVSKRTVTITPNDNTIFYGDAAANNGCVVENLYGTDTVGEVTYAFGGYDIGSDVDTYEITVTVIENSNYDFVCESGALTVSPRRIQLTVADNTIVYGNAAAPATNFFTDISKFVGDDINTFGFTFKFYTSAEKNTEYAIGNLPGDYVIALDTYTVNANYEVEFISETAKLTVTKRNITVTANNQGIVYGQGTTELVNGYTVTVGEILTGDNLGTAAYTINYNVGDNAGDYAIKVSALAHDGYEITFADGILTVGKATLTLKGYYDNGDITFGEGDNTVTYGDTLDAAKFLYTVEGWLCGDETKNLLAGLTIVSGCPDYTAISNVGIYGIKMTTVPEALTNYEFVSIDREMTVGKAVLTITAEEKTITYGEDAPVFTVNVTGFRNSDTETLLDIANAQYTCSYVKGNNIGNYAISAVVGYAENVAQNYTFSYVNGTLNVGKRTIEISVTTPTGTTYGDACPTFGYELTDGTVYTEDTLAAVVGDTTYSCGYRTTSNNAGNYNVGLTVAGNDNYTINVVAGTLTVDKKDVSITINPVVQILYYGDNKPVFTISATGLVNGDTARVLNNSVVLSTAYIAGADIGDYDVTAIVSDNTNYIIDTVVAPMTFNVKARPITISAIDAAVVYGDNAPESYAYGLTSGMLVLDQTLETIVDVTADCAYIAGNDAGQYDIVLNALTLNDNYDVTVVNGTLNVTPKTITVTPVKQYKVVNGTDPEFMYSYKGNLNGEIPAFEGKLGRTDGEGAGTYTYTNGTLALVDNVTFKANNYQIEVSSNPDIYFTISTVGFTSYGKSLILLDNVYINYMYKVVTDESVVEYGVLEWTSDVYNTLKNYEFNAQYKLSDLTYNEAKEYYEARGNSIAANKYNVSFYTRAYMKLADGSYVYGNIVEYSVQQYAKNSFAKAELADIRKLCVGLMDYGASVQKYTNKNISDDELCNNFITEEMRTACGYTGYTDALGNSYIVNNPTQRVDGNYNGSIIAGVSTTLGGTFSVNIYYRTGDVANVADVDILCWTAEQYAQMTADDKFNPATATVLKPEYIGNDGMRCAKITGIAMKDAGDVYYVCIRVTDTNGAVSYSAVKAAGVTRYASNNLDSQYENTANLCKAMLVITKLSDEYWNVK